MQEKKEKAWDFPGFFCFPLARQKCLEGAVKILGNSSIKGMFLYK
jgi:hypothetical protein